MARSRPTTRVLTATLRKLVASMTQFLSLSGLCGYAAGRLTVQRNNWCLWTRPQVSGSPSPVRYSARHKHDRIRVLVAGINAMSIEETYYWYAKASAQRPARPARAPCASGRRKEREPERPTPDSRPRVLIEDWLPVTGSASSPAERAAASALPPLSFLHVVVGPTTLVASAASFLAGLLPAWTEGLADAYPDAAQIRTEKPIIGGLLPSWHLG